MPKNKGSYINRNLSNPDTISVKIEGQPRKVYYLPSLYRTLNKIQRRTYALSKQYQHNVKFPSGLGLSQDNVLFGRADWLLYRVVNQNDISNISPYALYTSLERLKSIGKNKQRFENAYYDYLRNYYGVDYSNKRMRKLLLKGAFKYVPSDDKSRWDESDPTRILNWIVENMEYREDVTPSDVEDADVSFENVLRAMQAVSHGDTNTALKLLGIYPEDTESSEYDVNKKRKQERRLRKTAKKGTR